MISYNIKDSWINIFKKYDLDLPENSIYKLENIITNLYIDNTNTNDIFPEQNNIFECFKYFELDETKIVIIGQDPYHSPNMATGLCFATNVDCHLKTKIPPSLKNIIKELKSDINIELLDYSLQNWAKQGILLLNTSLTVLKGKPNSHKQIWHKFTSYIIDELNKCNNQIIFIAWGAFAHAKLININEKKHKLFITSHPSPLSVYKKYKHYPAFSGSKIFSLINNTLHNNDKKIIDW